MTQRMRDKIFGTLLGLASSVITGIILISVTGLKANSDDKQAEIDSKVDKVEFAQYKTDHEKEHEKEYEIHKDFREWMRDEMKGLRQDIRNLNNN